MENNRAQWGSKIGFILAAAGSAVGLGNIWKFPGKAFEGGGGAYILIYLAIVVLIGFPVMLSELTIGRAAQGAQLTETGRGKAPHTAFRIDPGGLRQRRKALDHARDLDRKALAALDERCQICFQLVKVDL